jgi:hypothetical protein
MMEMKGAHAYAPAVQLAMSQVNTFCGVVLLLKKIRYLETSAEISPTERETLEHFLIHTTTEHRLPFDADLIADVHLLARLLLGESLD